MSRNRYNKTSFMLSVNTLDQCPADDGVEVAFAGRSNVGKSSALNAITGNRRLARISRTPGRTQLLNFFMVDNARRLVDLPGYGYARVPEAIKQHWSQVLQEYFARRKSLSGLILIMDSRHPFKPEDLQMLDWCAAASLPVHVLLNKSDKLSRMAGIQILKTITGRYLHGRITAQLFSARDGSGVEQARQVLDSWFSADHSG